MIQKGTANVKNIGKIKFTYDQQFDQMKFEESDPSYVIGFDQMAILTRFIRCILRLPENKKEREIDLGNVECLIRGTTNDIELNKVKIKFD